MKHKLAPLGFPTLFFVVISLGLTSCATEQDYYQYQNNRLDECAHKIDDDYIKCVEQHKNNYDKFKKEREES